MRFPGLGRGSASAARRHPDHVRRLLAARGVRERPRSIETRRPGQGGRIQGGLVYDDAFAIAELDNVAGVVVEQNSSQDIEAGSVSITGVSVLGTTPDFPSVRDMEVGTGRYFNDSDLDKKGKIAVLGSSLAEELFNDDPIGQDLLVGNTRMTVVGVFQEKGQVGDVDYDSRLYTPITTVLEYFTNNQFARIMGDSVRTIYVELEDSDKMDDTILQLKLLLAKRHDVTLDEPDFSVTTQQDIIGTQESTTAAFRSLLSWVACTAETAQRVVRGSALDFFAALEE